MLVTAPRNVAARDERELWLRPTVAAGIQISIHVLRGSLACESECVCVSEEEKGASRAPGPHLQETLKVRLVASSPGPLHGACHFHLKWSDDRAVKLARVDLWVGGQ